MVTDTCCHHWVIESADTAHHNMRAESKGVCKHCGEVRMFKNSGEPTYYETVPSEQRAKLVKTYDTRLERLLRAAEAEYAELTS